MCMREKTTEDCRSKREKAQSSKCSNSRDASNVVTVVFGSRGWMIRSLGSGWEVVSERSGLEVEYATVPVGERRWQH